MAIPTSERAIRQAINTPAVFIFIVFPLLTIWFGIRLLFLKTATLMPEA
jgi:hypothetical protein